jgi:hypothetical protein
MTIRIVLTHEEAVEIFKKTAREKEEYTEIDEEGKKQTEVEWAYYNMGSGRVSWGVHWYQLNERCIVLLKKLILQHNHQMGDFVLFSAEKEVYPPIFTVGTYL